MGRLARGDAGPYQNATCAFRPSKRARGESSLSPEALEEAAIDFDGVVGSGVAGGGGLGGGHWGPCILSFLWTAWLPRRWRYCRLQ